MKYQLGKPVLVRTLTLVSLSLTSFASPAFAQIVVPTTLSGPTPTFTNAASNFVLNNSITCPTSTINLTGFGGNSDGTAQDVALQSQTADVTNFGFALGVSIPLGSGSLRKFCKKFAKAQGDFQESRTLNQKRNSQIALLQQCLFIQDSLGIPISKNPSAFSDEGALASFSECLELSDILDIENRNPAINLAPPPQAPTESATPESTPVTVTQ